MLRLMVHLCASFLFLGLFCSHTYANEAWKSLGKGLEFGHFQTTNKSYINILRIDPKHWKFSIRSTSETDNSPALSTHQWAKKHGLTASINAGMFHLDYTKHVGYLKQDTHTNSQKINGYKSIAAFSPYDESQPYFQMMDTDDKQHTVETLIQNYRYVVQNLRLIKYPAINRWKPKEKQGNEAALGQDKQGRVLFIYAPTPYNMHDFNNLILSLNIDLMRAQHLEGGLQAQLFINTQQLDMNNVDEKTTQHITQQNQQLAWKIPFVIGIEPR